MKFYHTTIEKPNHLLDLRPTKSNNQKKIKYQHLDSQSNGLSGMIF